MNLLIYSFLAAFWTIGLIVMIEGLRNPPEAYEDEDGFHYHTRSRRPQDHSPVLHHGWI